MMYGYRTFLMYSKIDIIMEPKEILKIWSQYFNEGNLNSIVNLYDKDSILFPTFSNF